MFSASRMKLEPHKRRARKSNMDESGLSNESAETPLIIEDASSEDSEDNHGLAYRILDQTRPYMAEMFGVTMFVFLGTTSATSGNIVSTSMAHGLTIMLLIISFGHISGGHFNPCVTLGALIGGDVTIKRSLVYWIAQLVGGILGAGLNKLVLTKEVYTATKGGIPELAGGVTASSGIMCEAILTFVLVLTVLMTAVDTTDNVLAPVAIGLAVAVGISSAANVSGAVMNPARALGPAVVGSIVFQSHAWTHQYIYWVGPLVGALVAGTIYRILLAKPSKRLYFKQ